jgi:quinol monooxygenase YgiN
MILELRTYTTLPGQRDAWVAFMSEVIVPFQTAEGMTIVGQYVDELDPDKFVWMRQFDDEDHLENLSTHVYSSSTWRNEIAPRISEFLVPRSAQIRHLRPALRPTNTP